MQTMLIHGEPVTITEDTFKATCQWWADNCQDCIDEALSGKIRVNGLCAYVEGKEKEKMGWLERDSMSSAALYFWQRAYYIQTGNSVSIL